MSEKKEKRKAEKSSVMEIKIRPFREPSRKIKRKKEKEE